MALNQSNIFASVSHLHFGIIMTHLLVPGHENRE